MHKQEPRGSRLLLRHELLTLQLSLHMTGEGSTQLTGRRHKVVHSQRALIRKHQTVLVCLLIVALTLELVTGLGGLAAACLPPLG